MWPWPRTSCGIYISEELQQRHLVAHNPAGMFYKWLHGRVTGSVRFFFGQLDSRQCSCPMSVQSFHNSTHSAKTRHPSLLSWTFYDVILYHINITIPLELWWRGNAITTSFFCCFFPSLSTAASRPASQRQSRSFTISLDRSSRLSWQNLQHRIFAYCQDFSRYSVHWWMVIYTIKLQHVFK